ncbi:MAG: hypothetical protein IK078_06395, partial [Lachnospiraceae bacterium]|nr:hypothetical protein [Lachnospiraceae bacterium]
MGKLADKYKQIQTQVHVNLGPEPDKATDPAGYIAYHKQSRKNARLASHARKAVVDAPLSYEQATAAIR